MINAVDVLKLGGKKRAVQPTTEGSQQNVNVEDSSLASSTLGSSIMGSSTVGNVNIERVSGFTTESDSAVSELDNSQQQSTSITSMGQFSTADMEHQRCENDVMSTNIQIENDIQMMNDPNQFTNSNQNQSDHSAIEMISTEAAVHMTANTKNVNIQPQDSEPLRNYSTQSELSIQNETKQQETRENSFSLIFFFSFFQYNIRILLFFWYLF